MATSSASRMEDAQLALGVVLCAVTGAGDVLRTS
jgi:hypothetical protein